MTIRHPPGLRKRIRRLPGNYYEILSLALPSVLLSFPLSLSNEVLSRSLLGCLPRHFGCCWPWYAHSIDLFTFHKKAEYFVIAQVHYACTVPNTASISFDDGPYIWSREISKMLTDAGAKGTFFVSTLPAFVLYEDVFGMLMVVHL